MLDLLHGNKEATAITSMTNNCRKTRASLPYREIYMCMFTKTNIHKMYVSTAFRSCLYDLFQGVDRRCCAEWIAAECWSLPSSHSHTVTATETILNIQYELISSSLGPPKMSARDRVSRARFRLLYR